MARVEKKLSDTSVRSSKLKPGRHSDGAGLYLRVTDNGSKNWLFMWKPAGKAWNKEMGLGSYPDVSLSLAREKARSCRELLAAGSDPLEHKRKGSLPTFGECCNLYIAAMEKSWRNDKHRAQWKMTLDVYAKPIRGMLVSDITTQGVLSVLMPIWHTKPETASRLRGRIEKVLDFARTKGWRTGENPALWRGHLRNVLPPPKKLSRGHHKAMPYTDLRAFFQKLRGANAMSARALELLILCASRSGEVLLARRVEFDLDAAVWTVPASRMKMGVEHRVPLSPRAVQLLRDVMWSDTSDYAFAGEKILLGGKFGPLSSMALTMLLRRHGAGHVTPHGFRSSFRDWAGDETAFPRELAEMALAHRVGDDTELAYRRSDALERRRALMIAWADYLVEVDSSARNESPPIP